MHDTDKGISDPWILIGEINPMMSPSRALKNVQTYNDLTTTPGGAPVKEAIKKLLIRERRDPTVWTYFSNTHFDNPNDEEEVNNHLSRYQRKFPKGIEFLFIQGAFSGGSYQTETSGGNLPYRYYENDFTVFIRVKNELGSGKG